MLCKGCKNELSKPGDFCALCEEEIHRHLKDANGYLDLNEFRQAVEELKKVLGVDKENPTALELKSQIQEKINKIKDLRAQAERCFSEGLHGEGIGYLDEILKIVPNEGSVLLQKQMAELVSITDPSSFVRRTRKFKPQDFVKANYALPSSVLILFIGLALLAGLVFLALFASGVRVTEDSARDIYLSLQQKITRREYYDISFLPEFQKLTKEYSKSKYAQKVKRELSKVYPQLAQGLINKGNNFFDQGRYKEAIEEYNNVFVFDPFNREASYLIGEAARNIALRESSLTQEESKLNLPDSPVAVVAQPESYKNTPGDAQKFLSRGEGYFKQKEYLKAIAEWEKAKALIPGQEEREKLQFFIEKAKGFQKDKEAEYLSLVEHAELLFKEQTWPDALASFEKALRIDPSDLFIQERARHLRRILNIPLAQPAAKLQNDKALALKFFIGDTIQKWKNARFKFYYQGALKEENRHNFLKANSYFIKANAYESAPEALRQVQINRLILELERRLKLKPRDYNLQISLGCLYYAKGWMWFDTAQGLWEKVRDSNPAQAHIVFLIDCLMAKITEKRGQVLEAREEYEGALSKADLFYLRNSLAKLFWREGLVEEAVQHWKGIQEKHPFQLDVINSLAKAYLLLQKQEELSSLLKTIPEVTPLELKRRQAYPQEVDPEYLAGLSRESAYFSQATKDLGEIYTNLEDVAEAIRWQRISMEWENKR